jgi:hypothetical protein
LERIGGFAIFGNTEALTLGAVDQLLRLQRSMEMHAAKFSQTNAVRVANAGALATRRWRGSEAGFRGCSR